MNRSKTSRPTGQNALIEETAIGPYHPLGVFDEPEPSNHLRVVCITKSCVQFRSQVSFDVFSPTISHTHKMDPDYSFLFLITQPATRSGTDGDGEPSEARRTARREAPRAVRAADGREQ